MTLPDGVLAYRVLNSANLNQEEMKLCRATINELKYDAMVKQLIRIYGDSVSPSFTKSGDDVPDESVFYSGVSRQTRGAYRGSPRGGPFQGKGSGYNNRGRPQYRARGNNQNDNSHQNKDGGDLSSRRRKLNPIDSA